MTLLELEPRWVLKDGKRVAILFRSPVKQEWWAFIPASKMPRREQWRLAEDAFDEDTTDIMVQFADPQHSWTFVGGIENATFETLTIQPSIDGSAAGLWHGFITDGQIVGGI